MNNYVLVDLSGNINVAKFDIKCANALLGLEFLPLRNESLTAPAMRVHESDNPGMVLIMKHCPFKGVNFQAQ